MNSGGYRSALVGIAIIVVVTLLIWSGVHNRRERQLAMEGQQQSQAMPSPDASASAAAQASAEGPAQGPAPKLQGKVAPAFTLVDLAGKKVSLADYKGKPVLVNFWATWCGPCKIEMPWFEEFSKKYAGTGFVILGVAADEAGKSVIANVAGKAGVSYPVLLKDDKVEAAYGGVEYLPESFYVDRTGKVMLETAGLNDGQGGKDEIEANIKKLIAGVGQ